ncbi:MAG: hypothetical protein CM1200mP6_02280 [Anaerolineaceae bacterium]|nr:MAG: hypothetical protein CM1200mP6_02280 [Anaerolineaceae bacterium]
MAHMCLTLKEQIHRWHRRFMVRKIGYGNKEMAEAIAQQVEDIPYYLNFGAHTTPPAAELAAKLATLTPGH